MENLEEYSPENLEKLSYRFLQQTAKGLSLPSNVKKVYLIQLIHAKKYCSVEQVENLVRQVRLERQQLALVRKRAKNRKKHILQSTAISSTINSKSPPIETTPKRVTQITIRYSPDQYLLPKKYTNRQIIRTVGQTTVSASDRVLRSSRCVKKANFILNNRLTTVRKEDKYQQVNMSSLLKNRSLGWRNGNEIVPMTQDSWKGGEIIPVCSQNSMNMSPQPIRRQRRLSGIYPLNEEIQAQNKTIVSVRRADGTLSKLKAYYIHKPLTQNNCNEDQQECESQSLLSNESTESNNTFSTISITDNYSNTAVSNISLDMSSETSLSYENASEEVNLSNVSSYKENQGDYTVYYHKKIRAEQVRCLRSKEMARCVSEECRLPKINDVFSNFSDVYGRDVTQPVYIQVENNPELVPNPPLLYPELHNYQTTMLEKLYNLKNVFIVNQPLLQIATTTNTRCVYSTPVICTAKVPATQAFNPRTRRVAFFKKEGSVILFVPTCCSLHVANARTRGARSKAQPTTTACGLFNIALSQDSPQYCVDDPREHDFSQGFRCEGVGVSDTRVGRDRSCGAASPAARGPGANVSIPEMVEDALELISQDGDYMERMGMDIRVQCVLCKWAGPRIILEYHIRNEHGGEISQCEGSEWSATYTLGALASRREWFSRVLQYSARLYAISAKYEDPDCFCATLSTISSDDDIQETGSITTYNKVSGEPYTWKGIIPQLPLSSPNEEISDCLKLELSRMNLLPNSANLKLLNRELIVRSPTKVIVGQPELNNINISLTVKIYDSIESATQNI